MKTLMKGLILSSTIALSTNVYAANWQPILTCEGGAVVVDVNGDQRTELQLVLKGDALLSRLHQAGLINLNYGQQEYVLRGTHAELRQVSSTETQPSGLGGVFYSNDFRKMIAEWSGVAFEVEKRGSELALKHLAVNSGYSCPNEGGCYDSGGGTFHKTYVFLKEYVLRGCN
jgi:hypothetical protein